MGEACILNNWLASIKMKKNHKQSATKVDNPYVYVYKLFINQRLQKFFELKSAAHRNCDRNLLVVWRKEQRSRDKLLFLELDLKRPEMRSHQQLSV